MYNYTKDYEEWAAIAWPNQLEALNNMPFRGTCGGCRREIVVRQKFDVPCLYCNHTAKEEIFKEK